MSQEDKIRFSDLRKLMGSVFGLDDLHDLFMDLHLDPENADGKGKEVVIRYLVGECHKQKKFLELLEICARERPAENWKQFEQLATIENDDLLAHPHLPVYKEWVVQQYNVMRLLSMERPLPLDAVYTDVYLLNKNQYGQNLESDQTSAKIEAFSQRESRFLGKRHSGVEMLKQEKHLFIEGKLGAGKTTFLRWLAVRCVQNDLSLNKIPILVELRRLNDEQYSLFELIVKEWLDSGFPKALAKDYVEQLIRGGDTLVLLDGLDEVRQELRERINNQIDYLVKKGGDSHMVITCRPHAETRRFDKFIYMEMAEFTPEQTSQFIKNWFGDEEEKANKLIKELKYWEQKPIQALTKTPLLLALICNTFDQVDELPQKWTELYSQVLEVVLNKWDDERGIRRDSIYGQLTAERKEEILAYVAYRSFEPKQLFMRQQELEKLIANYWQEWRQTEIARQKEEYGQVFLQELPEREVNVKQIFVEIVVQRGIFVEQAKDVYSFAHLSFQEYFAARYIASNKRQGTLERLLSYADYDQWREVFKLTASLLDVDADEFFVLFRCRLDEMVGTTGLLPQLIRWAGGKANTAIHKKHVSYRLPALYAWYIDLARNHVYDLASDRNRRGLGFALDCAVKLDHALGFDVDLFFVLAFARPTDFAIDLALIIDNVRAHAIDHAHDIDRADAITYLYTALMDLTVPAEEESEEVWQQFRQSWSTIIKQYQDLTGWTYVDEFSDEDKEAVEAMDWSEDGIEQYAAYLKATQLLVECLPLAMVSDRTAIEDQLFLPPEINEDEVLEKE